MRLPPSTILLAFLVPGLQAQTKISGTVNCMKPDPVYSVPAGDRPDHSFALSKLKCTWSRPLEMEGAQMKEDEITAVSEISGKSSSDRSYVVGTLSSGDKVFVRPTGKAVLAGGVPQSSGGTWTYVGGTGKFKGITGKGTFKCKSSPDGTSTCEVEGAYQLPKP